MILGALLVPHLSGGVWTLLVSIRVSGLRNMSNCFLLEEDNKSTLDRTLTAGTSRLTMQPRAAMAPDRNLPPSTMKWESSTNIPQTLKFQAWSWSTNFLITFMWVYSSIWPGQSNRT